MEKTQKCYVCCIEHPVSAFALGYNYCDKLRPLKPYQRFRIRKRNEDKDAFLANNAKVMLQYRKKNPQIDENYNHKRRTDPEARLRNCVINHAKSKGIPFDMDDREKMKAKLSLPCHYCNHFEEGLLNGLDRVDCKLGYSDSNTVPCCDVCNYMKHTSIVTDFYRKVHTIVIYNHMQNHAIKDKVKCTFGQAKTKDGPKRSKADKSMLLSIDEQTNILKNHCQYCGEMQRVGIDRINSEMPYTMDNVVPCCTRCNYMKKDLTPEDFLNQCLRIFKHCKL